MVRAPTMQPDSSTPQFVRGPAALRQRIRRDLEREHRRLAWIDRGPPARKALAARTQELIAVYQQLDRELSAIREQDHAGFGAWLERTGRLGAVMRARRKWPWWAYARAVKLARPGDGSL
ncbi:MAG TPA: hypothetical protein VH763_17115 [Gemmatimonadales bacterium]